MPSKPILIILQYYLPGKSKVESVEVFRREEFLEFVGRCGMVFFLNSQNQKKEHGKIIVTRFGSLDPPVFLSNSETRMDRCHRMSSFLNGFCLLYAIESWHL